MGYCYSSQVDIANLGHGMMLDMSPEMAASFIDVIKL
uniref:Uncharacterized protein n=1 Tax=Perkinsus marinus TaxID=31276 RepID=A7YXQ3_9ALVE|nr:unknown [Perkinsus marinus]